MYKYTFLPFRHRVRVFRAPAVCPYARLGAVMSKTGILRPPETVILVLAMVIIIVMTIASIKMTIAATSKNIFTSGKNSGGKGAKHSCFVKCCYF